MDTYGLGHPMHGRSAYDPLTMRIREMKDGSIWLRLEKVDAREFEVLSLAEDEPEPSMFVPAPPPVRIVEKILEVRASGGQLVQFRRRI